MTETYDYIVIGAGSAGSVVAAGLSEDGADRVLLLEAGGPDDIATLSGPPLWPTLFGTAVDWDYCTTPQPGTAGAVHHWPRGKVLGGSSSINGMIHIRGHRSNFDAWARAGAKGWDYEDVLPYFKRTERVDGGDPAYRGTDGPLRVGPAQRRNPITDAFMVAAAEAGYPVSPDINGAQQEGACLHDHAIVDGVRQSAAGAWLHPAAGRPNLTITTDAHVRRLLLHKGRCVGVEFEHGGERVEAQASGEVILSAGAIGSPQLLQLSGIGPADHLRSVGIDVSADLPGVGANLQDHPLSGVTYEARQVPPPPANGSGEASLLTRTDPSVDEPDIQLLCIHVPFHPPTLAGPTNGYTIGVGLMTPVSRGSVLITTDDPLEPPRIDPRYLADQEDVRRLLRGIDIAREVGQAEGLARWRKAEVLPGPAATDEATLQEYLSVSTGTYFHPVGTCRMGKDELAVVDPELRVRGIEGLRVVDASVMPSIVSGNTNAATLMIGERGADLIKGRQPCRS